MTERILFKFIPSSVWLLILLLMIPSTTLAGDDNKTVSESKSIQLARINISGSLSDALPPDNPFGSSPMYFKKLLDLIKKAAKDDEIGGIELKVSSPSIGLGKLHELNSAIKAFKTTGKKVFGYAESLGTPDLLILSLCDYLAIPESGTVLIPGLNIEALYYKELFERIGVTYLVEHIGNYKSAYENYRLDSMSKENREVLECLLDANYNNIVTTIAENRNIDQLSVIHAIDEAILLPEKALEYGLIDEICYRDQYENHIKTLLKSKDFTVNKKYGKSQTDLDFDNPFVFFSQIMSSLKGKNKSSSKNPKIALIYASGIIHSGKNSMDFLSGEVSIGSDTISKAILEAANDSTVKAIILRVNSPGGSGLASDIIWRAEMLAKEKKPLIVSMSDVAASGGYYIACPANIILAEANTITGSIGVVSAMPNISKTLDKLGIKVERISRGKNSGMMSLFTPVEEVNMNVLTSYMEDFYWKFVDRVAAGRKMTKEQVHEVAQGRVWTGKQALKNGLIDAIGGLEDAIHIAKLRAGLTDDENWELTEMPRSEDFFESLSENFGLRVSSLLSKFSSLNAFEALVLENPEIKSRLARLNSVFKLCQNERVLLLMPMDISIQF